MFVDQDIIIEDSNSSSSDDEDGGAISQQQYAAAAAATVGGNEGGRKNGANVRNLEIEIPERQGLLPPLPDLNEDSNNSPPVFTDDNSSSLHSRTQSLEKIMTPVHRSRTSSYNNKVVTPTSSILTTPKAEYQFNINTPPAKLESCLVTPVREIMMEDEDIAKGTKLNFSPTITIDERFDVKVDIPLENSLPKTTEDKIKIFEIFQKKEAQEFEKTLKSLKKGGWLSSKDLSSLENKKQNHFKKWENKIRELKNSLRHKKVQQQHQSTLTPPHPVTPAGQDFGYFSPKPKTEVESFEGDKSPNLQTLEHQFSVMGISHS